MSLIETMLGQPEDLPADLRKKVGELLPQETIQVFAMTDLDRTHHFAGTWVILTETHMIIATRESGDAWSTPILSIRDIEKVETFDGLTSCWLTVAGAKGQSLAILQYTRRQSRAIGNLKFAVGVI